MDDFGLEVEGLSEDGKKIVRCLTSYFDSVLKSKLDQIDSMRNHIQSLESRIHKLEDAADEASAYERRDTLIMSGNIPPCRRDDDCKSIIIDLLKSKTNLVIRGEDVSVAHRIGSKPKVQGPDKRRIMFKLVRRDLKSDILDACRASRPDFFINESLTPLRDRIYYVLRKANKKYPNVIHHCKTFDGNVAVFLQPVRVMRGPSKLPLQKVTVNTRRRLVDFLHSTVSSSFEDLGIEWSTD